MLSLGDRIKRYEAVTRQSGTINTPLIIRVDGRAFHTLTKKCKKPFDDDIMESMVQAALCVAKEMQGFKVAYVQSDEASFFINDYDTVESEGWFGYNLTKVIPITASLMSVNFNRIYGSENAVFDCRAFNVPEDDVSNVFLWRAKDWERNSLQMYCRSFFSHRELTGKKHKDMHEMLYSIGKNWATDLTLQQKNGAFITKIVNGYTIKYDVKPSFECIDKIVKAAMRVPRLQRIDDES
jgi:tRNA(His) 5'-end guanylyltransferase